MVAAGVYLMSRSFFLVAGSPEALNVIAHIGGITAFLAAALAIVQNDIKKILAYSTISQLGYMVLALGLGSSTAAMYHLTTHAFFKALLFLGAGAMIHALHTQDIWEMGGLLKQMPVTAVTFLIGTAALCGLPPFSGFFSKDEIILLAYEHNRFLYAAALLTAALTAFYMTRTCCIAVIGPKRIQKHGHDHAQEAPIIMKAPLVILAFLSVVAGFIGIPEFIHSGEVKEPFNLFVAFTSVIAALIGIFLGAKLYANQRSNRDPLKELLGKLYQVLVEKYYLDEFFSGLAGIFQNTLAKMLFWFDWNIIIQKGVNGVAGLTARTGSILRRAQTGRVQTYSMVFGFGVAAILYFMLMVK
jgi:NADH-quinone oxidoreductase subunit L